MISMNIGTDPAIETLEDQDGIDPCGVRKGGRTSLAPSTCTEPCTAARGEIVCKSRSLEPDMITEVQHNSNFWRKRHVQREGENPNRSKIVASLS